MIIKGRSPIVRHVSRIHRAASDWLFDRSNVDSKIQIDTWILNINSQIFWPKVMSHITMEQSSSFVQHHPCQASLLRKEFRLDELLQNDGEEGTGTGKRMSVAKSKSTPDELVISCSDKFLIREKSDCIQRSRKPHDYGETWKQDERKSRIRRSVEFSSATERCVHLRVDEHSQGETCSNKRGIRGCGFVRNLKRWVKEPGKTKCWKDSGDTIFTCLQPQFISTDGNTMALWMIWTWKGFWSIFLNATFRAAVHLDQTMLFIYDTWKTIFRTVLDCPRSWKTDQWWKMKSLILVTGSCGRCSHILSGSLVFLGPWIRKDMVRNFHRWTRRIMGPNRWKFDDEYSGHPIFRAWSAFETGDERSKGDKKSIHFNGSNENIELLRRMVNFCESAQCLRSKSRKCAEVPRLFRSSVTLEKGGNPNF